MAGDDREPSEAPDPVDGPADRRRFLKYGVLAALAGVVGVGGALRVMDGGDGDDEPTATPTEPGTETPTATPAATDDWLPLVRRFAPDLYYGARERWFPTDPRPYAGRSGDPAVVDGFDALVGYTEDRRAAGGPPHPTVFYNVVPMEGSVVALQYWMYSVFDQFTVNFHWHDWELLQVFVDVDTEEPVLLSASAHARSCPNNEVLRPDFAPGGRPVVLAEVGSHSSATDVNDERPSFERLAADPLAADVTNAFVRPLASLIEQPFAYGLPRDEGARLPYVLPELDGVPVNEHPDVDLDIEDFVDADVTVRDWGDLARPPGDLPGRERGTVLAAPDGVTDGDATYELVPLSEAAAVLSDFTGPQLSFEFAVPGFLEDRVASHITTAGIPWQDPRASDPVSDVTDPAHRRAVAGEAPPGLSNRVVGAVSQLGSGAGGTIAGPDDPGDLAPHVPVSLFPLPVEVACLLRSDPVATTTAGGVFRFLDVEAGSHELVVNGPGLAPYAERFDHTGGTVRPGVDGRVVTVANEDAAVLRADRREGPGVARVRVVESFVGPVYDARPVEADRFAIPVHRDGTYTVEIVDREGVRGVVRVDPADLDGEPIQDIPTGKAALAGSLAEFLAETAGLARELAGGASADGRAAEDDRDVPAEFEAAAGEALEAADVAEQGEAAVANERLLTVVDRLLGIRRLLDDPRERGYTDAAGSVLRYRAAVAVDRAEAAYGTRLVG